MVKETDLYPPIKAYLMAQGYEVKAEVAGADVVAQRGAELPVVVELKTRFSLALFHQGITRLALTDTVYIAVPRLTGRAFQRGLSENVKLARRLGLGLLTVRLSDGLVEPHCDPGPYAPRKSTVQQGRLLREFAKRDGDPNLGGTRGQVITAYRQDALRCVAHLAEHGPSRGAAVRAATGVDRATAIMRDDHYGWFERLGFGTYGLTSLGAANVPNKSAPQRMKRA